ncbi:ATP-dependent Clp protease proteolytic subunit [Microvirga sp. 2TAF3]|uniref:ATP-dependent Clp protease proteolytic subunit n=1 Tax=Microvirga sp. 2TAF3 TaxID=3233014 RepID=UPI003F9C5675
MRMPEARDGDRPVVVDNLLFNSRRVLIIGEINHRLAKDVVSQLYALAAASDDPITVVISSPGGHVESGDLIFDTIRFIKPKVIVIGSGWVASAGALIYVAAERANRYSLPNTRFLLHQPFGGVGGTQTEIAIQAREMERMRLRLNKIFAEATGQSLEKIEKDSDRDFWLNVEEAKAYGLVGRIISSELELLAAA